MGIARKRGVGTVTKFNELQGKVLSKVIVDGYKEWIEFYCTDGSVYKMFHSQDCCEDVSVKDIDGDFDRLLGQTVLLAEERVSDENPKQWHDELWQWTFYTIRTIKDSVTIRWYGESNGYYSVDVDFELIEE